MAPSLYRAREILRTDGARALAAKAASSLRARARRRYWNLRGTRTLSVGGTTATFDATGRSSRSLQFFLENEAAMVEAMLDDARPDDVLWDVGANVGFHAALVGQHVEDAVAFEPVPPTAERLAANLRRNGVDATVRAHALGDADGEIELESAISPDIPDGETLARPVHAGDSLAGDDLPAPTMLKVDVEGAEGDVLAGMDDALADCRVAYVEVHRPNGAGPSVADFGHDVGDIYELLDASGFDVEVLVERDAELHLKASRSG